MGRRKKDDVTGALTMKSQKSAPEVFDNENEATSLEALASEETELLESESESTEAEAKPAPRPKRTRRPRKKPEVAMESTPSQVEVAAPVTEMPAETIPAPSADVCPLPEMSAVPQSIAEATVSSRVLHQVVSQLTDSAPTANEANTAKQLAAVKEISVTICSQLDRMAATMMELQGKYATALQELNKEKAVPRAAKPIPVWLVATSGLALLLSIVSFSLTQATRHSILGNQMAMISTKSGGTTSPPSPMLNLFATRAASGAEGEQKNSGSFSRPTNKNRESDKKNSSLAKRESGTTRRNHR